MRLPAARSAPPPSPRPLPTPAELAALDVQAFLRRLDDSAAAISESGSFDRLLPADLTRELLQDPRRAGTEAVLRSSLRGLLVATSFFDLPEMARAHPAVQQRMWSAMDDMDAAVHGIADTLSSLSPEERGEITRALRADPTLGQTTLAALDAEAQRAGVSEERRAHLRRIGEQACFRLRQSTSAFIDEYTAKIAKTPPRDAREAERYLAAQMGDTAFRRERDWHFAVAAEWQKLLAAERAHLAGPDAPPSGPTSDATYAPPAAMAPPPAGHNPDAGKTVLRVGAWLFGIGVFFGATGALLVNAGSGDVAIAGLVSLTAAALFAVGGILCLLIGGILRLVARGRARDALEDT